MLKLEDILKGTIETISPEMRVGDRVKQLRGYADAVSSLANRALQHIHDAKFFADLLHVHRPTLVSEARISGDDKERANARQRGDDLLNHAIDEISLLGVAAHIREGQHGY